VGKSGPAVGLLGSTIVAPSAPRTRALAGKPFTRVDKVVQHGQRALRRHLEVGSVAAASALCRVAVEIPVVAGGQAASAGNLYGDTPSGGGSHRKAQETTVANRDFTHDVRLPCATEL
jgi:hypothetical protein